MSFFSRLFKGQQQQVESVAESLPSSANDDPLRKSLQQFLALRDYRCLCDLAPSDCYVSPSSDKLLWDGFLFTKSPVFGSGCFRFLLQIPPNYGAPDQKADDLHFRVLFLTECFHPLISSSGELNVRLCVSLLGSVAESTLSEVLDADQRKSLSPVVHLIYCVRLLFSSRCMRQLLLTFLPPEQLPSLLASSTAEDNPASPSASDLSQFVASPSKSSEVNQPIASISDRDVPNPGALQL